MFPPEIEARLLERPARVISSFAPPPPDIKDDPDAAWRRATTHIPPQREALLVLRGACTQSLNGAVYRGTPGTLFLFDINDHHDDWFAPGPSNFLVLTLQIYREFVLARMVIRRRNRERNVLATMLSDPPVVRLLNATWDQRTRCNQQKVATRTQVEMLVAYYFAEIAQLSHERRIPATFSFPRDGSAFRDHQVVGMLMLHICFHNGRLDEADEILRAAGYNKTHLARIFQANVGCTIKTHINQWRLRHLRTLESKRLAVKVRAQELGFSSSSAFDNWRRKQGIAAQGKPLPRATGRTRNH